MINEVNDYLKSSIFRLNFNIDIILIKLISIIKHTDFIEGIMITKIININLLFFTISLLSIYH